MCCIVRRLNAVIQQMSLHYRETVCVTSSSSSSTVERHPGDGHWTTRRLWHLLQHGRSRTGDIEHFRRPFIDVTAGLRLPQTSSKPEACHHLWSDSIYDRGCARAIFNVLDFNRTHRKSTDHRGYRLYSI